MFVKKPSSFQKAAKPIIYFNWLMGMGINRQSDLSDAANFGLKIYSIIFAPTYWTLMYIGLPTLIDSLSFGGTPSKAVIMYKAVILTNACISVIAPLLTRLQKKMLKDCLRQEAVLNDTFQATFGVPHEHRKQYIRQISQILTIVLITFFMYVCDMLWIILLEQSLVVTIAISLTLHYPVVVMLMMDANFCYLLGNVRNRFQELNKSLLRLAEKPSASHPGKIISVISRKVLKETSDRQVKDMKTESLINDDHHLLHEIRKLHFELSKISRKINHAFGIQNLLSTSTSFVMITGLLYTIYTFSTQKGWSITSIKEASSSSLWVFIYASKIWMVNHTCSSLSNEALRSGELIYGLLESKVDKVFLQEVQEFALQMLQNPVRFDACGFFTLDYTFVQGVIGSITTYLVILIQMSNSPEKTTSNAAVFTDNGTEVL